MGKAHRDFQIFTKPVGALCNLDCDYCYYLEKQQQYPATRTPRMSEALLERYIVQLIRATPGDEINFFWHGGEPLLMGLDHFRRVVDLQQKHKPRDKTVTNSIQTNGTLIDNDWADFLSSNSFKVGISLDGPKELHDGYRKNRIGSPSHEEALRGFKLLINYNLHSDILCVVHAQNAAHPEAVYHYFKSIGARYISFIPLVEAINPKIQGQPVEFTDRSVSANGYGEFLSRIFDIWVKQDVGKIMVQIFEEVAREALGQPHSLCIFRKTCGDVPVLEHNGDFYTCDHYVDSAHLVGNLEEIPLVNLLDHKRQQEFGRDKYESLTGECTRCEFLSMCHGGCPKDRSTLSSDGEPGHNYLCEGYKLFFNRARSFADELKRQTSRKNQPEIEVKIGRNDPCPCGSGKKYKKCCITHGFAEQNVRHT